MRKIFDFLPVLLLGLGLNGFIPGLMPFWLAVALVSVGGAWLYLSVRQDRRRDGANLN